MKEYSFRIFKDKKTYLAELYINDEKVGMTQGYSLDELFDMVADAFKAVEDIKCSFYRRMIYKIFRV